MLQAPARLPTPILPSGVEAAIDLLGASPGVIEAIGAARSDPDDLPVTLQTAADGDRAIGPGPGPGPGRSVDMQPDPSAQVGLGVDLDVSRTVSPFDHDPITDDDHLGSVMMPATEREQGHLAKLASSAVEGSATCVICRAD